jgi:cation:H+ antiporter
MTVVLLLAGLVLLVAGAEVMVRGAVRTAGSLGVSPLIIGLTVVALGTSSPELAVSVMSAAQGQADIALGNVVGSNIFNVLFLLGLSALIAPLVVAQQLVRLDVPLMIALSVLVLLMGLDGRIGVADGTLLVAGLVGYTFFLFYHSRRETEETRQEYAREYGTRPAATAGRRLRDLGLIVSGLVMLVLGSRWLVAGAVSVAEYFGVSALVIGLTVIAAGTSLPEVATSVVASLRGERDIAVGNVVGSNIFNILCVLGLTAVVAPEGISVPGRALQFDIPVMIAVAVACLPIFFTGHRIARWEGAVLLGYYIAFTTYLVLEATRHATLPMFTAAMTGFVIPLTVLTLVVVSVRALRRRA